MRLRSGGGGKIKQRFTVFFVLSSSASQLLKYLSIANCKSRIMSTVHAWFTVTSGEKIKVKSPQFVQKRTRRLWEEDKCGQLMWHNFSLFFCNFKTLSFIYLLSRFKVLMENLCFENFLLLHKFSIKYLEFNNRSQLCKCWIIYSGKVQNRWFLWFLCNSPMTRASTIEFLIYRCRNAWITTSQQKLCIKF